MVCCREVVFGAVLCVLCVPTLDASSPRTRSGTALRCLRTRGAVARRFKMEVEAGRLG
ncbi:hypothetical protein K438DRAFT_1836994 [Mycena galopus ATCC 62051]|nr:hypothetical protein K438DRAFT_1836994 [Mycena galopus ATCC 62051]